MKDVGFLVLFSALAVIMLVWFFNDEEKRAKKKLNKLYEEKVGSDKFVTFVARQSGVTDSTKYSLSDSKKIVSLYEAKGRFSDDESVVYNFFRNVKSILDLNFLNRQFKKKYGLDIFSFIEDFMNEAELLKVYSILKTKKDYTLK